MRKSHYSLQNQVFLAMLKDCRNARHLRQSDVGAMLGRDQALVSKVESGERRLDVIELRAWLAALDADLVGFVVELDERINAMPGLSGSVFGASVFAQAPGWTDLTRVGRLSAPGRKPKKG